MISLNYCKVEALSTQGKSVILEIELLGARAIKYSIPDAYRLFILPPSLAELEKRLRRRGTDSEEALAKRLVRAQEEIAAAEEFDHQIVNDDFEIALAEIEAVIKKVIF
ncbi:MAG: hypothetical protein F6K24_28060 [Okeania sp. SIO2D1]|nr:hypothetical protein [Okeania sp. SIO2D1]